MSCDPRELGDNITHSNDSGTASVSNGVVLFNGTEIGSVARLICDNGFSPSGPVIRMCVSSGNWSGQSQSCGGVTNYSLWWIPLVACVGVAPLVTISCVIMLSCIWARYRWHHQTRSVDLAKHSTHSKQADVKNTDVKKVKNSELSSKNNSATLQARPSNRTSVNIPVTDISEASSSTELDYFVLAYAHSRIMADPDRPAHRRDFFGSLDHCHNGMDAPVLTAAHSTPVIHSASCHSHYVRRNSESWVIHSPSYPSVCSWSQ